nr:putative ribonuclease H-like domain-containing protein [Tanacetum cinerariifolium]
MSFICFDDLKSRTKDETSSILRKFITEIENLKDLKVKIIRYDNRGEFRNKELNDFCSQKRIKREFSNARTPQQNGVAERRNRSLIEAAKTMVLVNKAYNKTPYELFNGRTPAIGFLKPFGCHVMILNTLDNLDILGDTSNSEESNGMEAEEERIDYDEVFAPVARIEAIRLFLAYASFMGFTVYQMDVKSAFLYGTIDEEVYVMQPPGFQDLEYLARVYKVEKSMGTIDQTLFIRRQRGDFILVQVYMDDIIFGSSNPQLCREFEALMHEKFQMSAMGELNFFLGLQVLQKEDGIFLSQDKYVGDILKKFGYSDVRSSSTPMDKENPWGKDGTGKDVNLHLYRSMIGSLMYLTASRPDIMFAVCACARHQVTPKECHLYAVKRIFRYLKGHLKLGLWYPKDSLFDLVAYSDSDYGGATQ